MSIKTCAFCPGWVAQWVGASPHTPGGCGFHPWVGACSGRKQQVDVSHIDVSLSLVLSLSASPSLSEDQWTYPWVRIKKQKPCTFFFFQERGPNYLDDCQYALFFFKGNISLYTLKFVLPWIEADHQSFAQRHWPAPSSEQLSQNNALALCLQPAWKDIKGNSFSPKKCADSIRRQEQILKKAKKNKIPYGSIRDKLNTSTKSLTLINSSMGFG